MKALFIINPSSGRQNFQDKIKEVVGTLIMDQICNTIDVFYTEKQYDARDKACSISKGEYDFVVAVGGDGTLNEVVTGVIQGGSRTPIAVISAGTVNDFATYLNLPQTPEEFCEMIRNYRLKEVDAGKVNDQYFINVVAAGMLSDIGFKVDKDKKALLGKLAYYLEGALDIPKTFMNPFMIRVTTDEENFEDEVLLFMITNSRSVGGFREIAPQASTSDGKLDVVVIKKLDFLQVAPVMIGILQGQHVNHPAVSYFQATDIVIENLSEQTILVDFDGELLEDDFPIHVEIIPGALSIVVPGE